MGFGAQRREGGKDAKENLDAKLRVELHSSFFLCVFAHFGSWRLLKLYEFEFGAEAAVRTIVKGSKLLAIDVVLYVAWIPVVCNVEYRYPDSSLVLLSAEGNPYAFRYQ